MNSKNFNKLLDTQKLQANDASKIFSLNIQRDELKPFNINNKNSGCVISIICLSVSAGYVNWVLIVQNRRAALVFYQSVSIELS